MASVSPTYCIVSRQHVNSQPSREGRYLHICQLVGAEPLSQQAELPDVEGDEELYIKLLRERIHECFKKMHISELKKLAGVPAIDSRHPSRNDVSVMERHINHLHE